MITIFLFLLLHKSLGENYSYHGEFLTTEFIITFTVNIDHNLEVTKILVT